MNLVKTNLILQLILTLRFWNIVANYFTEIEDCKITTHGREYIGNINWSNTNRKCFYWTKEILIKLELKETDFPDLNLVSAHNYCRNPNQSPNGPWCITDNINTKWEYCHVPSCIKDNNWCKNTDIGKEYIGQLNITKSGKICQSWTSQNNFPAHLFSENNFLDMKNSCRNPDGYANGPWCYTSDRKTRWEECNVPKCENELSQIEYFGGYDFLKTIKSQLDIIRLGNIHENATFVVSLNSTLWNRDIKRKTSLWATDYDTNCQTDLNEYEYCELSKSSETNSRLTLVFKCKQPLKNFIFISPLLISQYKFEFRLGSIYGIEKPLSSKFLDYQKKVYSYLNLEEKTSVTIPSCSNHGSFYLIDNNAVPYAINPDGNVVFTISEVGKGRIGFIGCEDFTDEQLYPKINNFLRKVYNRTEIKPISLTKNVLQSLSEESKLGKDISIQLIWNSHNKIGVEFVKLLLELINDGLKIVIGIKPWAYNYYRENLENSELKLLFKNAGIWPSLENSNENIQISNEKKIKTFPLIHLLEYSQTSFANLKEVAEKIGNMLFEIPFAFIGNENEFTEINSRIQELSQIYIHQIRHLIPCLKKPITDKINKDLIYFFNGILIYPFIKKTIAPGISFYPGKFQSNYDKTISIEMSLNLQFNDEVYQLGQYISPGTNATVNLINSKSPFCTLYINFHLFNVVNKNEWEKWPLTKTKIIIYKNILKVFSFPFGGLLSLSCKEENDNIDIMFTGVYQVPVFDRRDPIHNVNWNRFQQTKVPWAILAGDSVVFVVSINTIRNFAQPDKVLKLYDSMIKEEMHLRGKLISENRRELISTDLQIKAGYMHAGYPIGTMIQYITNPHLAAKYLFDEGNIKIEGRWGILHEIGHNLQDSYFTFSGTVDVTNNVFTLVGIESMTKKSSWSSTEGWASDRSVVDRFVEYINYGDFKQWQNEPFLGLGVYAQLRANFGWELYSQVFRKYDKIKKGLGKMSDVEKIQLWIKETSFHTGMNLCPLYDLWRWPIDGNTNKNLSKYSYFLPDDFLTKLLPIRTDEIIFKYGDLSSVKRKPIEIQQTIGPLKNQLVIEGRKVIEKMTIFQ